MAEREEEGGIAGLICCGFFRGTNMAQRARDKRLLGAGWEDRMGTST